MKEVGVEQRGRLWERDAFLYSLLSSESIAKRAVGSEFSSNRLFILQEVLSLARLSSSKWFSKNIRPVWSK
jgi:hypothetical protein